MPKIPDFLTSDTAKNFYSDAVRHALVGLAGILVARGYITGNQVGSFIEAGMAIAVAWGWQIWENLGQAKATAALKQTASMLTNVAQVAAAAMPNPVTPPPQNK